jgi:HAD superfamily hydrolase (TIGR01509 family)
MLEVLEIKGLFTVTVGADMVEKSKPAPDMVLLGSKKVGVEPNLVVYVGDQPTDVRAGNAAGVLASVMVRNNDEDATENTSSVADFIVS